MCKFENEDIQLQFSDTVVNNRLKVQFVVYGEVVVNCVLCVDEIDYIIDNLTKIRSQLTSCEQTGDR